MTLGELVERLEAALAYLSVGDVSAAEGVIADLFHDAEVELRREQKAAA